MRGLVQEGDRVKDKNLVARVKRVLEKEVIGGKMDRMARASLGEGLKGLLQASEVLLNRVRWRRQGVNGGERER